MSAIDVRIEHVWKEYRLGTRRGSRTFSALRDLTCEVPRGSSLGIVGRNGAGKSTLLKLLAGITAPTRGRITIDGRLAALIEVGSGFHPELTGRENVFLSGAILGMRRKEIEAKLSSIVDFAGVEAFIDTPVKWYSSGMYVRLGFSIAAHLEPDILLVDEVLAVGDAEFQAKCLQRVDELTRRGVTILLISHDLSAVERLCSQAIMLEKGEVVASGPAADVVSQYHRSVTSAQMRAGGFVKEAHEGALAITGVRISDPVRQGSLTAQTGNPLIVSVQYDATRPLRPLAFELSYFSPDGRRLIARAVTDAPVDAAAPGGEVEFTCPELVLRPGAYCLTVVVREMGTPHVIAWWDGGTTLHVEPGTPVEGEFHMPHSWRAVSRGPMRSSQGAATGSRTDGAA